MLWLVRFQLKESTSPNDYLDIDHYIAAHALPTFERVDGVKSARAFHSIHGQIVFVIDLENTGSLDAVFEVEEVGEMCQELFRWLVRTGGAEIMWEISSDDDKKRRVWKALTFN